MVSYFLRKNKCVVTEKPFPAETAVFDISVKGFTL